jgi:hypothetical protein
VLRLGRKKQKAERKQARIGQQNEMTRAAGHERKLTESPRINNRQHMSQPAERGSALALR